MSESESEEGRAMLSASKVIYMSLVGLFTFWQCLAS